MSLCVWYVEPVLLGEGKLESPKLEFWRRASNLSGLLQRFFLFYFCLFISGPPLFVALFFFFRFCDPPPFLGLFLCFLSPCVFFVSVFGFGFCPFPPLSLSPSNQPVFFRCSFVYIGSGGSVTGGITAATFPSFYCRKRLLALRKRRWTASLSKRRRLEIKGSHFTFWPL